MKILIIGGDETAKELLRFLNLKKNEVIVVDSNSERCEEISREFDVYVINRDATDVELYTSEVSVADVDVVIALTGSDETNLFVLSIAKAYNVPIRITKVSNPRVADLVSRLGLGIPISPSSLTALMITNFIDSVKEVKLLNTFDNYKLYLVSLSETDRAAGKSIKDLELPHNTKILLIFDGSKIYSPDDEVILGNGYQLLILSEASEEELTRSIKG